MSVELISSFQSKTRGPVEVFRGYDEPTRADIFAHSTDPGIVATLGEKDLKRFAPDRFPSWVAKGGGRFMYVARIGGHLAGLFWIGGEAFPVKKFPDSPLQPGYTAAWRTAYSTPEGTTYEGEGVGKRIALAGIRDVAELTKNGGPTYVEHGETVALPPLTEDGIWIDTGTENLDAQVLYHNLGNTARGQEPVGFEDMGVYVPPFKENATPQELEPRQGMIATPQTIDRLIAAGGVLLNAA
jgi:hypothetical protein